MRTINFPGGETEITLIMPRIAGSLVSIPGVCVKPDGSFAAEARIDVAPVGRLWLANNQIFSQTHRADAKGRFELKGVPAGKTIRLYAETEDRKFAGTNSADIPANADPSVRITIPLEPSVAVDMVLNGKDGKPLASRKFEIWPTLDKQEFRRANRTVESDAAGRIKLDGIVPGLPYRVQERTPPIEGPILVNNDDLPWFEKTIVLAPK